MFPRSVTRMTLVFIVSIASLLFITSFTKISAIARPQADLIVNPGESIQAAIDAANDGDTIIINAGDYTESLTLSKPVSLTGVNSDTTIIHAVAGQRVLTVTGATIGNSVVISGLTFTGGNISGGWQCPTYCGGGILITDTAQPLIQNVIITGNQGSPGGLYTEGPLMLIDTDFLNNSGGGAIADAATVTGGLFANTTGGRALNVRKSLIMTGTRIMDNTSGGVSAANSAGRGDSVIITNAWFENNLCMGCTGGGLEANVTTLPTGTLTLINTTFISNTAQSGGGLYNNSASLTLIDTDFISNTTNVAYEDGGGMYVGHNSQVAILRGHFIANSASRSGGGLISLSPLILTDTIFMSNTSTYQGGGAVIFDQATLTRGYFENNLSLTSWGGWGGGLLATDASLSNTVFVSNSAGSGGGALIVGAAVIVGGRFEKNRALGGYYADMGGGALNSISLVVSGTVFSNNASLTSGGGLYITGINLPSGGLPKTKIVNALFTSNTASNDGAALYADVHPDATNDIELIHTTIAGTNFNQRSAIAIVSGTLGITNTIIANHAIGISNTGGTVTEDYNLFYGNSTNTLGVITGTHSLIGDPRFVDPAHDDYHLTFGSAAIDHGVDAGVYTDLDGNPRPIGNGFDIGAYEFAGGGTRYVATTGDDTGNICLDQATPCATIQHAIDVANEFEEVRIATGVYTDVHTVGAIQIAALTKTLTLRGGYTTTDWLTANPVAYPTTLDGQGHWRALYALGNISPTYIGLRIVNGAAPSGGGLYALNTSTTISDCELSRNSVGSFGGGVYASGPITISGSRFISNSTMYQGGALYASARANISDSRFEGNTANSNGGGLYAGDAVTLTNVDFISNTAQENGGAVLGGPSFVTGGHFIDNHATGHNSTAGGLGTDHDTTISGTTFLSNSASFAGGGLYANYTATLYNTHFEANHAITYAGGLFAEHAWIISGTTFSNNSANKGGGAIVGDLSFMTNTTFIGNSAAGGVGGLVAGSHDTTIANSLFARNTGEALNLSVYDLARILHTTIADPITTTDPGILLDFMNDNVHVYVIDSIIANRGIGIEGNFGKFYGTVVEDYNLFYSNVTNTVGVITGAHSLIGDPRFVDPAHDDYHLAIGSAAIDHGVDAGVYTDLDGHPRPIGSGFDIGAYEYQGGLYRAYLPIMQR